ncbi:MAG: glycine-rich protein [Bacteroidales bacterium]|nr:glycine-rich protein [Bacteroidales bacterium]
MAKFITKTVCMALLMALCAWSGNAQNENRTDIPTTGNERSEINNRTTAPRTPRENPGEAPSKELQETISVKEFVIPSEGGRGPSTVAYGFDNYYWEFRKFPLNDVGNYSYLNWAPCPVTGGDWVDGYWYAVCEEPNYYGAYILKIDPATGSYSYIYHSCYDDMISGMAYSEAEGVAYIVGVGQYVGDPNNFYKVNLTTGATTSAFSVSGSQYSIYDIAFTSNGRLIGIAVDYGSSKTHVVEINPSNGAVTILITAPFFSRYEQSLAYDRGDDMLYWTTDNFGYDNGRALYKINLVCNKLTKVCDIPSSFYYGILGLAIPTESSDGDCTKTFEYTGDVQQITLDPGVYEIECWGANGMLASNSNGAGGIGGYSKGTITITSPTTVYIYVGQQGQPTPIGGLGPTAWNGGGNAYGSTISGGGGGGASHVTAYNDFLTNSTARAATYIVAGGGGGAGWAGYGGNGGGSAGSNGHSGTGGTQTGTIMGQGANCPSGSTGGGGGGGWYGGNLGSPGTTGGAGGGSGYIGGVTDGVTAQSGQSDFVANPKNDGNGFVRITSAAFCGNIAQAPTNFEVIPNNSAMSCNLFWFNPTHTINDDPLTSITKIVVLRDGVVIQEFSGSGVGAPMTFTDNTISAYGEYCYEVYAVTAAGNGVKTCEECVTVGNPPTCEPFATFGYYGAVQSVTLDPGTYEIECWGANGGGSYGGMGGYSRGTLTVTSATTIYVYVGGGGSGVTGGYNGGGNGISSGAGGGGATHVATSTGLLSSLSGNQSAVKIVAGGAGGTGFWSSTYYTGGDGGGLTGGGSYYGTQTGGGSSNGYGTAGSFGQGGSGISGSAGGGGGGWYGGAGYDMHAGGGSGYIGGVDDGETAQPTESGFVAKPVSTTNGYVQICRYTSDDCSQEFSYTGSAQPITLQPGTYEIECWGANGGTSSNGPGGTGGYSKGTYTVSSPTTVYIYVGGAGTSYYLGGMPGGWNGGGYSGSFSNYYMGSGGGGTDVRTTQNTSYANRIIVAGGGGGSGSDYTAYGYDLGGNGGGTNGADGFDGIYSGDYYAGKGGTQSGGGTTNGTATPGALGTGGTGAQTGGGGGGGYYGGGGGYYGGGGGGSGYIGNVTYGITLQPTDPSFVANPDNSGNGFVRITSSALCPPCKDVTIGTGTSLNYGLPVYDYHTNSYSQQLYLASEINASPGSEISSISFNVSSGSMNLTSGQTIYLANTTKSSFANTSDWVPASEFQQVYTGAVNYSVGWVTIQFDTPFEYTGGNIAVAYLSDLGYYHSSPACSFYGTNVGNRSLNMYNTSYTSYNPSSLPAATYMGALYSNVKFHICTPPPPCDIVMSLPWTEGFEGTDFPPDCWTRHDVDGASPQWEQSPYNSHTGTNSAYHNYTCSGDYQDGWLVTPKIAIPADGKYALEFWSYTGDPGWHQYAGVWISTTTNDPSSFIELKQLSGSEISSSWKNIIIPLDAYSGQNVYIAFRYSGDCADFWHIDDVKIDKYYKIDATVVSGSGTITPLGETLLMAGSDQTYTIAPATCYEAQVLIDGMNNIGDVSSYSFTNVNMDHTIDVTFTQKQFTVTTLALPLGLDSGLISPSSPTVTCGGNQTFYFYPPSCYRVAQVLLDGADQSVTPGITTLTVNNVQADRDLIVIFEKIPYTITASVIGTGGTITPLGPIPVECGDSQKFTFIPDDCYEIDVVWIDDEPNAVAKLFGYYTFDVQASQTISVSFVKKTYNITPTVSGAGDISPNTVTSVDCGENQTFTFAPTDANCGVITDVKIDGVTNYGAIASGNYTFYDVHKTHTIAVTFGSAGTYNITALASSGGTISPLGATSVACGATPQYTITPNACFVVDKVYVGITEITTIPAAGGTYTFPAVYDNQIIFATFKEAPGYTIVASVAASGNGSITPSGSVAVACGDTPMFTFTPDECYEIDDVMVNTSTSVKSLLVGNTYTFPSVNANQTIQVSFAKKTYDIVASVISGNGTISPAGTTPVDCGENQSYTITPTSVCGTIVDVKIDGVSDPDALATALATGGYTFYDVHKTHTIGVAFEEDDEYTITVSVGDGVTVYDGGTDTEVTGTVDVPCDESITLAVEVEDCYDVLQVLIDGYAVAFDDDYTFANVHQNHTLTIITQLRNYTVTALVSGGNGTVTPDGMMIVNCGDNQEFIIVADACYELDEIWVDGFDKTGEEEKIGADLVYTLEDVTDNMLVVFTFKPIIHTIAASVYNDEGGTITPDGNIEVACGGTQTFTIEADDCYNLTAVSVLIDGVPDGDAFDYVTAHGTYTFDNVISDDYSIEVTFTAQADYLISVIYDDDIISMTPTANTLVACGGTLPVTFSVDACYEIDQVLIDGDNDLNAIAAGEYTFTDVRTAHSIAVTAKIKEYTITAVATLNGTINPNGIETVDCDDDSQEYSFEPENSCYEIDQVLIDGFDNATAKATGKYTFKNVTEDHTIIVSFKLKTYTIAASVDGGNGTITPDGDVSVMCGGSHLFFFAPDHCYEIDQVLIDGTNDPAAVASGMYLFTDVTKNQSVEVSFKPITYTITATIISGDGAIDPGEGAFTVDCDGTKEFKFFPDAGFQIYQVLVNGINDPDAVSTGIYTFTDVSGDQTIDVIFTVIGAIYVDNILSFGQVALSCVPKSLPLEVTISNLTDMISVFIVDDPDNVFEVETSSLWDLYDGGTLIVKFTPIETKSYTATLVILDGVEEATVTLYGIGVIPTLTVTPTMLDFGGVYVSSTSPTQTITVLGTTLVGNITCSVVGPDAAAFTVTTTPWNPLSGGTLNVTFTPDDERIYEATIILSSPCAAETVIVTLTGEGMPEPIAVTEIVLDCPEGFIHPGDEWTMTATIVPDDATNQGMIWSSANTNIVDVDEYGNATALEVGTTIITVTTVDGGLTAECLIQVIQPVTGVKLNKQTLTLVVGAEETLIATVLPVNAGVKDVFWTSSDPAVTVDANGKVTAMSAGSATITVTTVDGGFTDTCVVTVLGALIMPTGVTVTPKTLSLKVGDTYDALEAEVKPVGANPTVTWTTNNAAVATVDASGVVTGVAAGKAIITAKTVNNYSATCTVTVTANKAGDPIVATMTDDEILVYPNPTTGELKITRYRHCGLDPQSPENDEIAGQARNDIHNVDVFDIMGREQLSTFNFQLSTLDLSLLPPGVYFVRIQTETGVVTRKVVKE